MKGSFMTWQMWAVLSAFFAALTAILAKIGIQNINSDFATFIRTIVVLLALGIILLATGQYQSLSTVSPRNYPAVIDDLWLIPIEMRLRLTMMAVDKISCGHIRLR